MTEASPELASDRFGLRDLVQNEAQLRRFYLLMDPARLLRAGHVVPNWMGDGRSFWFAEGAPAATVIRRVDGETGAVSSLFDVGRTRDALGALLRRELPHTGLPFDSIVELADGRYRFVFEGGAYRLSCQDYSIESCEDLSQLPERMRPQTYRRSMWLTESLLATEAPSPDGRWFARVHEGNVVLRASADDRIVPLTSDGTADVVWQIEAPRPRPAAGSARFRQHLIDPWSPDGRWLFAVKADRRAVPKLSYVRYLKSKEEVCTYPFQRAGRPIDLCQPHALDAAGMRRCVFELGDTEDHYFTLIGWRADSSEVLFTRHSRDFKSVAVLAGHPASGRVRTLFEESCPSFVALQHEVLFFGNNHATFVPDGSGLIWRSSRTGWSHFYFYAFDGAPCQALTRGAFPVIETLAVDQGRGWLYFTAHHDQRRPYDIHLCRVSLRGGDVERLTSLDGQNDVSVSPSHERFTVVNSRPDRPYRTDFHRCDGARISCVQSADAAALDEIGYVLPEEFTVTAADGTTPLWGVMYKPADFDPHRKYPLIDHIYAGPQVSIVAHHFGVGVDTYAYLDRALAQLGYIVISLDARGTPERSKAFQDVVYGNWGRYEIPDHAAAIRQLAQRHAFIDPQRVGVFGHSWGGAFAIRALAQAPECFRVAVASAPGSDVYDSILYEPFLDLPQRARAAYEFASNHGWVRHIRGKLMMIVGTADACIYANTMDLANGLIGAGIEHDLVVLPEAGHIFRGKDEEYAVRKLVVHFERHLRSRPTGSD